ncbi:hypothetical protein OGAPHI_006663 [Ogataea philodendri]|uniref:Uncharacterized protein n=1 Tax=Ogataea philodendri TaxID=1378263 RepID=A0A9P8NXX9_9ASCO|nr:uncharacterized protein OGAPHI_006663 [Ogataea philodendri]KAH3661256.1 hypothetical protein OGAPHI_006663 [Ogataea philodendri]
MWLSPRRCNAAEESLLGTMVAVGDDGIPGEFGLDFLNCGWGALDPPVNRSVLENERARPDRLLDEEESVSWTDPDDAICGTEPADGVRRGVSRSVEREFKAGGLLCTAGGTGWGWECWKYCDRLGNDFTYWMSEAPDTNAAAASWVCWACWDC